MGRSSHPAQVVDHAVLKFLREDPVWVLFLRERGQALFPGTYKEPHALEGREERVSTGHS